MVTTRINKTIGILRKLQNLLSRFTLITVYKAFVRPHIDYGGGILYHQAFNLSFHQKLEFTQYRAYLATTGATRGTSGEIYQELGLESLQLRRWHRKLAVFNKIHKSPFYLFKLIPEKTSYATTNGFGIPLIKIKHNFSRNTFFPSAIILLKKLDP